MPLTSKELAKLAGVSQATISRCLNDSPLVSEETKARVKKLASEYMFQLNSSARGLKTNRTGVIGYVFSEDFSGFANHYIQSDLYYRLRLRMMAHRIDVVPVFDDRDDKGVSNIEKCISNRRFDALVVNRPDLSAHLKDMLSRAKMPFLFIYDTDEQTENDFMIYPSHVHMGYMVGKAFCERGMTRFVEMFGTKDRVDGRNKHRGFAQALAEYGREIPDSSILYGEYKFEPAFRAVSEHVELFREADACFAQNDMMALGILEALRQNGIRVPEDIVLVGSDNIPMATWFKPYLTTIALDYDQIIETTASWIVEMMDSAQPLAPRKQAVSAHIIYRETF